MSEIETRLTAGRDVLRTEGNALLAFAEALDESFAEAVGVLKATKGRIVISGMGKSGHVARKMAATFASTGAPAQFVHPGEASHGDLGMVTPADSLIVLSNSGETPELADIIAHAKRFSIPLIGVAGRAGSTLLTEADVAIKLTQAPEACPNGLAPTTSTTMTLALGDALAVALMKEREFGAGDFRVFHPGGKLGAQLMRVNDLMHTGEDMPLIAPETQMSEALLVITQKGFGTAGVVSPAGRLIGVITDGDLRRNMDNLLSRTAGDVMTADPRTIDAGALAQEALNIMSGRITTLFVTEPETGAPTGILHIHDLLRAGIV
ncbi:KpsF/GutQ family sugar-phosphate isomerase [Pontivivens insulae]|uniref:Arabinose 5-phosphate isomerase KdsD n=1 Tax=Pontivivens insulae TaxID=1639689 RepID=A0A2R8A826_9RHOB|nr:KpsF/GutQ family sugar-phosphate isomerase [Pontivivens insulae]RED18484.1 arabinose-5-phosphate isomerase [Pontivivens insulae]SPF28382.1 Arabinose 5-phosphate isomerase KdsD [Pontivivens insulae]